MGLPVIDVPSFKLTIPGTKKTYKFRPFLVKENNILTQAVASENITDQFNATRQIVGNCCMGDIDVEALPLYQLQWIFLELKSRSVGEDQDFILTCGDCEAKINYQMKVTGFEISDLKEKNTKTVMLNDQSGIVFKFPSAETHIQASELSDMELLVKCIDNIFTEDEVMQVEDISLEELNEFIERCPVKPMNEAIEFFSKVPTLVHIKEFNCSECGKENRVAINGIEHFFA